MTSGRGNTEDTFWGRVSKTDGCWIYNGWKDKQGYGQFKLNGRIYLSHRLAYSLANHSDIPDGLCVCHKCDNPSCVNPEHLFLGTHADNVADKVAKGRGVAPRGEQSGMSKLTNENVLKIRELSESGKTNIEIAKEFGIHNGEVSRIVLRKRWAWL